MNKKKASKKVSSTNLLEQAINTQKELTKAMIGLSREVVRATDIREKARREHIATRMHESFSAPIKMPQVDSHLNDSIRYAGVDSMRNIKHQMEAVSEPPKTPHRESLDKITFLAIENGRAQVKHDKNQEEIIDLKRKVRELEEIKQSLERGLERERDTKQQWYGNAIKLQCVIDDIKHKVEKKARYKGKYSRERHVDARRIYAIIASNLLPACEK